MILETTDLELVATADLISELDKRADRVIIISETDAVDGKGMNWLFHHNGGYITREFVICSLMRSVKDLVSECLGEQNGS